MQKLSVVALALALLSSAGHSEPLRHPHKPKCPPIYCFAYPCNNPCAPCWDEEKEFHLHDDSDPAGAPQR